MLLNSDLAGGLSDVLSLPRAIMAMRQQGVPEEEIAAVLFDNAVAFYRVGGTSPQRDYRAGQAGIGC